MDNFFVFFSSSIFICLRDNVEKHSRNAFPLEINLLNKKKNLIEFKSVKMFKRLKIRHQMLHQRNDLINFNDYLFKLEHSHEYLYFMYIFGEK